uniref:Uncharacterized protein n=1 Tax=Oryza glumipatula TaxID=40148 RepID=A0A0E0AY58_9ORYZ
MAQNQMRGHLAKYKREYTTPLDLTRTAQIFSFPSSRNPRRLSLLAPAGWPVAGCRSRLPCPLRPAGSRHYRWWNAALTEGCGWRAARPQNGG